MSRSMPGERNPNYRHGGSGTRTHRIWKSMRGRCNNPKNPAYHKYGGRGIRVCRRWDSYANFLADMGECPRGRSLDRKNNNKGYSPDNCRWATPLEQGRNTRQNRLITRQGKTMCLSAWAANYGVTASTLWKRLHRTGRMQ